MAILETEAVQLSNAVRDAMVALRTLVNGNQITNNLLETTAKTDLVSAVNELKASIDALSYDDLADLPTIPATVAELTDATTYDFPTLNTPVSNALAAKANSADLGTISTFEGDQNLRTTDSATFAGITIPFPSVADFTDTFSGNVRKCQINSSGVALRSDKMIRWSVNTSSSTADSGIGRGSIPASVAIGNSAVGDASGTVQCANLTASGTVTGGAATFDQITATGFATVKNADPIVQTTRVLSNNSAGFQSSSGNHLTFYAVGNAQATIVNNSLFAVQSGMRIGWSPTGTNMLRSASSGMLDTGFSRLSPTVVALGNGTAGDTSGSLSLANLTASGTVKTGSYTVGTLPTPSTGMRAYVTDSNRAANGHFGSAVIAAGGGTEYIVPVFYDGTDWIIA